jgi:predicted TIM-barrel fold metal-dependent hydrolase
MRIDTQCHIFPKEYGDFFVAHSKFPKAWERDGKFFFDFDGAQMLVMDENVYKAGTLLSSMDDAGISLSLISCNILDPGLLPIQYVQEGCRIANAAVLREVRNNPDRFAGIAFLPWNMPEEAMKELTWAHDNGFKGVMLFSHNGGVHTDDMRLEPVYAECERLGMPIVIHPGIPLWYEHIGVWGMVASVSFVSTPGLRLYE